MQWYVVESFGERVERLLLDLIFHFHIKMLIEQIYAHSFMYRCPSKMYSRCHINWWTLSFGQTSINGSIIIIRRNIFLFSLFFFFWFVIRLSLAAVPIVIICFAIFGYDGITYFRWNVRYGRCSTNEIYELAHKWCRPVLVWKTKQNRTNFPSHSQLFPQNPIYFLNKILHANWNEMPPFHIAPHKTNNMCSVFSMANHFDLMCPKKILQQLKFVCAQMHMFGGRCDRQTET